MPSSARNAVLDYLHALEPPGFEDLTDEALMERFVVRRESSALTALIQRHGPLVWGVCRRVLREEQSAEDAFQATFLVLLNKAGSLRKTGSLRSWLYGVALRVARRARDQQTARRERERLQVPRAEPSSTSSADWEELRAILDEEVQRLPEKYRLPVVLCYLEGRSTAEAAHELDCPAATVATRLARAREQLRVRLSRRGLAPSGNAFAALLAPQAMSPLPAGLVSATAQAGSFYLTGNAAALAPAVATLIQETLQAMFLNKLKPAFAALLAFCVLGGSLGALASREAAAPLPEKSPPVAPRKPAVKGKFAMLLQERVKVAEKEFEARNQEFLAGRGTLDILHGASLRLLKAEVERARNKAERVAAHRAQVKRATEIAKWMKDSYDAGRVKAADHFQSEFHRLDAEIELERELAK